MSDLITIRQLEEQLEQAKRTVAATLYQRRHAAGLSLSQVARAVRVSAPTVQQTEKGERWSAPTVARLWRFFERRETEKANGQGANP